MIPFVREIEFEYGVCDRVSPLIRRVVANNPGPDMDDHLDAILAATAGERITHIFVTHNHADHSPLARPLAARTGATIYACAKQGVPTESEVRMEAGDDRNFRPDIGLCDGGVFSGGDWTLEAIPTPGHTSNHICYALLEENALFSGDHIMGWSTTVISPPDGDMGDYFESLERIKARDFSTLWPTHGPPVTDPAPFVQAYIDHRKAREKQILSALAGGHTRIKAMVPELYKDVDSRLYPAAAHSVMAHMVQMVRDGRLVTDGEPTLDSDYRLKETA